MDTAEFIAEWKSESPTVSAHTSGSTGKPKHIELPKADMRVSARATNAFFGIGADSVLASPLSTDYIAGKMMVVRAMEAGCRLVELPVSNEIVLPDTDDIYDLVPVVPSQIDGIRDFSRIRHLLIGGAAPTAEQCLRLAEAGVDAWISYGMTETCSHVALARASDPDRIFTAMPGISFATDAAGRLIIQAPDYSFGELQTNDVVELLSPQTFRWRGRADGVINSGGIKLFPEELEALYAPHMDGAAFFVRGVPDEKWGQAVELVVETKSGTDTGAIMQRLRSAIADHRRLPKHISTVATLPRTSNGKIRRH